MRIRNKIGYPDKWRDYSSVASRPAISPATSQRDIFESKRQLNKIGTPLDRGEWQITPPTVNAYYDPQMNDINFPAGVLQPPLLRRQDGQRAQLRQYRRDHRPRTDPRLSTTRAASSTPREICKTGGPRKTPKKFEERTGKCVSDQYRSTSSVDDININSKLTLGENVADLGGEILAYMAWKDATKDMKLNPIDGLTPEQRFFIGFAQWDCANERPEQLREWAMTNPHSPAKYRINGVVVNMPEFAEPIFVQEGPAYGGGEDVQGVVSWLSRRSSVGTRLWKRRASPPVDRSRVTILEKDLCKGQGRVGCPSLRPPCSC